MTEKMMPESIEDAVRKFDEAQKYKSFRERNPHLGKMINCAVCNRRHWSVFVCQQRFAVDKNDAPKINQHVGKSAVKGKRILRHPSKFGLQLVQRTQQLFDAYAYLGAEKAMKAARAEAGRTIRLERKEVARQKRNRQHISRHINRGLIVGNQGAKDARNLRSS